MNKEIELDLKNLKRIFITHEYPQRDIILYTMEKQLERGWEIIRGVILDQYIIDIYPDYELYLIRYQRKIGNKAVINDIPAIHITDTITSKTHFYKIIRKLVEWGILKKRIETIKWTELRGNIKHTKKQEIETYIVTEDVIKEIGKIIQKGSKNHRLSLKHQD